jgi:hypothetical protein
MLTAAAARKARLARAKAEAEAKARAVDDKTRPVASDDAEQKP